MYACGSKFRKTRDGRARLDVLRTINASCTAARLDITDYIRYCHKHPEELRAHPERFTPFAVRPKELLQRPALSQRNGFIIKKIFTICFVSNSTAQAMYRAFWH